MKNIRGQRIEVKGKPMQTNYDDTIFLLLQPVDANPKRKRLRMPMRMIKNARV